MDSTTIGVVIIFLYLITVIAYLCLKGFKTWDKDTDNETRRIALREKQYNDKKAKK